ncbi:MAG: Asp-tRNA(Asn)/Glu-tRNA(Gln) amidotransferase subunit GatC [Gammaproteobacteria bacterium]
MLEVDEVQAVARLARLALDPAEVPAMAAQLSRILTLVDAMNQVDTDGIEPLAHPIEPAARRRADAVTEVDHRADFQAVAPATENGYYLVPRVVE